MKAWLDSGVPQSHRVGALVAPFLGGVACWNKSSWRRLPLGLTEPFHRGFRTPGLGCLRPNYREGPRVKDGILNTLEAEKSDPTKNTRA